MTARARPKAPHPPKEAQGIDPSLFMRHQLRWIQDQSRLKIFEKSRRIGGTWGQSFEDVLDCVRQPGLKVWFSSADLSAASEYLSYCEDWLRMFNQVAKEIREVSQYQLDGLDFADEDKDVKVKVMEFKNGSKITSLSSNPKAFRSKGGKIVWDEAAWHDSDKKMWAAAKPASMWGYPIRILSTHNGVKSVFNQIIETCKKGTARDWSHHRVTILDAVDAGLVDRIMKRPTTQAERDEWLANERAGCLSDAVWQQEYLCNPIDETTAFLPYDLIRSCERDGILGLDKIDGPVYLGMDVGRRKHLSVIYVCEKVGTRLVVRHKREMHKKTFAEQREVLFGLLTHPRLVRACLDASGLGMQLAEESQEFFGRHRVEAISFTAGIKEQMAHALRNEFEDATIDIPPEDLQREGLHAVRATVSAANQVRFVAEETEAGHGDHFWALALGVHAARDRNAGPGWAASRGPRSTPATAFDRWMRDLG